MSKDATNPNGDLAGRDMAYVALIETKAAGREVSGWYLGLAVRDEPGYHQLKPGYGPYENMEQAMAHALELNKELGHDERSALKVVLSSMATSRSKRSP